MISSFWQFDVALIAEQAFPFFLNLFVAV